MKHSEIYWKSDRRMCWTQMFSLFSQRFFNGCMTKSRGRCAARASTMPTQFSEKVEFFGWKCHKRHFRKRWLTLRDIASVFSVGKPSISIMTFNILAPCWKRYQHSREAEFPSVWKTRQSKCIDLILEKKPDTAKNVIDAIPLPIELSNDASSLAFTLRTCHRSLDPYAKEAWNNIRQVTQKHLR